MGRAEPGFDLLVVELVRRHAPDLTEGAVSSRASQGGKWVSVTVMLRAESKAQLDAIYLDLTAHEKVRITSYNVCYTKLLRGPSHDLDGKVAGKGEQALFRCLHALFQPEQGAILDLLPEVAVGDRLEGDQIDRGHRLAVEADIDLTHSYNFV